MARQGDPADLRLMVLFLRSLRGLTQEELARASGVDRGLISDYELGKTAPTRRTLLRLTAAVGLPYSFVETLLPIFRTARVAVEGGGRAPAEAPEAPIPESIAEGLDRAIVEAVLPSLAPHLLELEATVSGEDVVPAAEDRAGAGDLWESLAELPPGRRRLKVERERRYWQWALAERVAAESARAAAHQADQAVELASLGLRLAELALVGETFRCRLQGYVLGFVANSFRVQGELRAAEEAFLRSDQLWEAGAAADPGLLDGSRLLDLKASLRTYQGRFQEALALLDQARLASRSEEARGRILIKRATNLELMGQHEQAIVTLREAENLAEGARAPRQLFLIRFTLVSNLKALEKYTEAEALLPEVRQLAEGLGNELDVIRVRWLEAGLAAALGRREEALAALEQVRRYFTAKRMAFDAALVTLELAVLELEQGRTAEVKRLAAGMLWIFKAQGVHQEALAALRLFCEAAEKEKATARLARRIVEYLNRARHQPELRFEG
jgi:transcriptional regulator with XRE-family HTH domain